MKIPHAPGVVRAILSVRLATKNSLESINKAASQRMAKGDYLGAETLASKGKEIQQFQAEVDVLLNRWKEVRGSGKEGTKLSLTPLWMYYQPILQGLVEAGGDCNRTGLEDQVERLMVASLQTGDRMQTARGRERWRSMVQRARKPLVAEGWIDAKTGSSWRITAAGRRAAEKTITKDPGTGK
jgi:hypothetical protein